MSLTVRKIVEEFDELDAFEAAELIEELACRGYELKINRSLEKNVKPKHYGLYLDGYDEGYKIQAIKLIRTFNEEYADRVSIFPGTTYPNSGLAEAKRFAENKEYWTRALVYGKKQALEILKDRLNSNWPKVEFKIDIYEDDKLERGQFPPAP